MTFLAHLADRVLNRPLLITPTKAEVILSVLAGRIGVNAPDASRFEGDAPPQKDGEGNVKRDMWGDTVKEPFKLSSGVGIVTITGSLVNRGAWVGASSGLTSYEGIQFQLKRAAAHEDVRAILLDLHSPGGEASGAFETAAAVRAVAAQKPVTAVVNGMAASAAYAIASGATRIVTTGTGVSGSIGVVLLHADFSRQLANDGIKPTLIFAGAHKVDGNPFEPLPDTVREDLQAEVDAFYGAFLSTVAAGRGARLTADMARATEARTFIGQAAVDAGLADAVGTFESALAELSRGAAPSGAGRIPSQKGRSMSETQGAPAADTPAGITQAQLDSAVALATAQAEQRANERLAAERSRMAALDALAAKCAGQAEALRIIGEAKASGATAEATALKLFSEDVVGKIAVLGALQADDATAAGATPAPAGTGKPVAATPEAWSAEWAASATLQAQYPSSATYVAFKKAEAAGRVRILDRRAG